tara:strand:- start:1604 stop:2974 length:1371 start_codon:yes stop_codon:yes gene_type:complete
MQFVEKVDKFKEKWFDFIDYEPHPGQEKLHSPPGGVYDPKENPTGVRFTVACCGRRFGKSFAAAREAELLLVQPGKTIWIVAPTYETADKIFRIVYEDLVIKKKYKPSRYSQKDKVLEFDWDGGKSIICGKSAEHPSSLIGEGCDLVIFDEASKVPNFKKIWEMYIRPTLSDKKGRCIFISTPDGFSYFHELFLLGQADTPNWHSFNSPSWDNFHAFPEGQDDPDLIEARATLSKEIYNQEYGAEFTALSGRVYSDFSRVDNTGDYKYDPYRPTFLTVDFGYRMPAVLFFQTEVIDGKDHIFIIDEIIHRTNLKTLDLVNLIESKKYRLTQVYGDPAGYQVQSSVGIGEAHIFRQLLGHQVFALRDKASRNINSGISHVRNFICAEDGTRRLHIDTSCHGIIEDIESYRYPETKEGLALKDLPLKDGYSDHGADALRYGIINKFPIRMNKIRTYAA